ncbi:MAG: AI-2E family transporter [Bacteroidia bacterium]
MKDLKLPFYAKASLIFIGLSAFISMLYIAQHILLPVIYATIIAIVLSPAVNFLTRRGMNRTLAIAIALLFMIGVTILLITILSRQMIQLSDSVPLLLEKLNRLTDQAVIWISHNFNISLRKINGIVVSQKVDILDGTSAAIGQTIISMGNMLVVIVLIPVYVFMILFYQPLLLEFIHKLFVSESRKDVNIILAATKKIIQSYLVGLLLEAGIVAALNSAALLILGIDFAILLGVVGAIVNVIPYIGGLIAVALPMMIALATGSSASYCLLVLLVYVIIQFIDNHYIIPKVVASKVKINALVSIIVVLAGGALWGVPGMFLSIPLIAIIKVIFDNIEQLKPWGFLLGDTMPPPLGNKLSRLVVRQKSTN